MSDHDLRLFKSELTNVMRQEAVEEWLNTPLPAFGHRTPARVIAEGEIALLWRAICGPTSAAA